MKKKKRTRDYSTTTAGDNGRMLAAEQARDSVFALVPCTGMARDSGALGSCTGYSIFAPLYCVCSMFSCSYICTVYGLAVLVLPGR